MNHAEMMRKAIRQVGGEVCLINKENRTNFIASIQPKFSEARDISDIDGYSAPVGYVLYAPADAPPMAVGNTIETKHSRYAITQCETAYLFGEPLYYHALLREEEEL